jgi:glutamyl/glutaminyl-tRNA synthetase
MTKRTCVFTGLESNDKDSVIPRHLSKDPHNWTSTVPTTTSYKEQRKDRLPTELEIQAADAFYQIETLKTKLEFYENRLAQIQDEINSTFVPFPVEKPKNEGKRAAKKKDKEIEIAEKQKDIQNMESKFIEEMRKKAGELTTAAYFEEGSSGLALTNSKPDYIDYNGKMPDIKKITVIRNPKNNIKGLWDE